MYHNSRDFEHEVDLLTEERHDIVMCYHYTIYVIM